MYDLDEYNRLIQENNELGFSFSNEDELKFLGQSKGGQESSDIKSGDQSAFTAS